MKLRFDNLTPIHEIGIQTKPAFDGLDGNDIELPVHLNILQSRLSAKDFEAILLENLGKGLKSGLPYLKGSSLFILTQAFIDHCPTNPVQYFEYKTATIYSKGLFIRNYVMDKNFNRSMEVNWYSEISEFFEEVKPLISPLRFRLLVIEVLSGLLNITLRYRRDRLLIDVYTAYQREYEVLSRPLFN